MSAANNPAIVQHTIRYDDLSAVSDSWIEQGLVELLVKHRVPCTFAAIPFVCDPIGMVEHGQVRLVPFSRQKAAVLKPLLTEGLAEIALHGFAHLLLSRQRGQYEFSSRMPIKTQRDLIQRGRDHLESVFGRPIRLFVPPWENIDASTIDVLREQSMTYVSGCSVGIMQTEAALRAARRLACGPSVVSTILHDYDFRGPDNAAGMMMGDFDQLLGSWAANGRARHCLVSQVTESNEERAAKNANLRAALKSSRMGRLILRHAQLVNWDSNTARRLARWAFCLP